MTRILDVPVTPVIQNVYRWQQAVPYIPTAYKVAIIVLPIIMILGYIYIRSGFVNQKKSSLPPPAPTSTIIPPVSNSPVGSVIMSGIPTPCKTPSEKGLGPKRKLPFSLLNQASPGSDQSNSPRSPLMNGFHVKEQTLPVISATLEETPPHSPLPTNQSSHTETPYSELSTPSPVRAPQVKTLDEAAELWAGNPVIYWVVIRAYCSDVDWSPLHQQDHSLEQEFMIYIIFKIIANYVPPEGVSESDLQRCQNEAFDYLEGLRQTFNTYKNLQTDIPLEKQQEITEFLLFSQTLERFFPTVMAELKEKWPANHENPAYIVTSAPPTPQKTDDPAFKKLQEELQELRETLESVNESRQEMIQQLKVKEETLNLAIKYLRLKKVNPDFASPY